MAPYGHRGPKSAPAARGQKPVKPIQSRSYPRGVGLDFRKLAGLTLQSFIDHHGELNVQVVCQVCDLVQLLF